MEEQLAMVLAKMEEQSQQLSDLARQQAERLDGVATWQMETEHRVATLQDDLEGVKHMMRERLLAVEGKLVELDTSHGELAVRQESLKEEICSGGMGESTGHAKSILRPSALPFVPSGEDTDERTASTGGGEAAGTARALHQRPVPYDGKTTWDAYRAQFEMLALLNGWDDAQKATYLAISLRGPAVTVLTNLSEDQRRSYTALSGALESRFGCTHQTELNRSRLKSRTRRRDESLPELAEDIERLTRLAYPDAPESMVDILARDQLVDALPDDEMRLRIRQSRPETLKQALQVSLELESYQLASRQRPKMVREAQLEWEPGASHEDQQVQRVGLERLTGDEVLQQILEVLKRCTLTSTRPRGRRTSGGERGAVNKDNVVCWGCKEKGHFRRECRQRPALGGSTTHTETEDPTWRGGVAQGSQLSGNGQ
jgi:hypothetical protein